MLKHIKQQIPNFITILNLFAGCIAIVLSSANIQIAAVFIFIAAVLDFADGFFSRMLNAYTESGKILDSLADMISFGVAPSMIMYNLLKEAIIAGNPHFTIGTATMGELRVLFSAFLIAVFSAIRLARFSVEKKQSENFTGLPTPASGIFIASMGYYFLAGENLLLHDIIFNIPILITTVLILSALMISPLPMFSLKFENFRFGENQIRFIFLGISFVLILLWGVSSLMPVIIAYVIISALNSWIEAGKQS